MFVLVVDTSLMNVSIAAVVEDLDTTVSSVQSAIALEALVSAAFILISSKIGDLFGRKRAYVLGLLGYAIGALAMTLAQSLTAIIIFWAIIGGLGASLLLPAMQSLIHGNFEGAAQKKTYALVGAAAAIAAAVGPLLGGFVTTYLSWRVGFLLEAVVIAVVLSQIGLLKDVPYTGERQVDAVGAGLSVVGMGGVVLGILVWQEGGDYVVLLIAIGALALWALARWLVRRHREGKVTLLDPDLFRLPHFRVGITGQMLQNITLGGAMIALPIFLQIKLEYDALETGLSIAPLSLTMFAVAILAGRRSGGRRPAKIIRTGFALSTLGIGADHPDRARGRLRLVPASIPLVIAGAGLGLLVSQLNNYTLAPIDDERISEAAGVNSASGSFGLSFGLAVAGGVLLATLSLAFTNMTNASPVIPSTQQQQIAQTLEDDAQVVSNTQLDELLADEPPAVQEEILEINTDATEPRPSGGAARADPRGPPRALQLVPHDAPAGHRALGLRRSSGARLSRAGLDATDSEGQEGQAASTRRGVLDLPKAIEERLAEGRAERESVPLEAHGEWATPDDRPDPVGILEKQNATRVPELVPIRHGRMIVSPFTFYRGSAAIMASDLSRTPDDGVACAVLRRCAPVELRRCSRRRIAVSSSISTTSMRRCRRRLSGTSSAWWRVSSSPPVTTATVARSSGRRRALPPRPIGRRWPRRRAMRFLDVWYTRFDADKLLADLAPKVGEGRDQVRSEGPGQGADADEPGLAVEVRAAGRRRLPDQAAAAGDRAPARDDVRRLRADHPPGTRRLCALAGPRSARRARPLPLRGLRAQGRPASARSGPRR